MAQTLPSTWDRVADWVTPPASAAGTTAGNPAPDSEGNLVYHYERRDGGALGSASPWYEQSPTPLVWDPSWWGQAGTWVVSDNFGTTIGETGSAHLLNTNSTFQYVPVVRWENATARSFDVRIEGSVVVRWAGNGMTAFATDVDYVIVKREAATGAYTVLFSTTVSKPTANTQIEEVTIPVAPIPTWVSPGDDIIMSHRAHGGTASSGRWINLIDELVIVREMGVTYCSPGVVNSSGAPAVITAIGSSLASANDVTLRASDLPPNAFGFFIASRVQGMTLNAGGSQGTLCLAGPIGRYVGPGQIQNSGPARAFSLALDTAQVPQPNGFVAAMGGETWNFQAWHRDAIGGMATSNFTDAVSVTFR